MLFRFLVKTILLLVMFTNSIVFAKEFKGTSEYYIADIQTKNTAIIFARDIAKQSALEQAGAFVSSLSLSSKGLLQKDDIKSITIGFTKLKAGTEVTNYSEPDKDGGVLLTYSAIFDIDENEVEENLKKYEQDNRKIETLKSQLEYEKKTHEQLEARYKELQKRYSTLKTDKEKADYQEGIVEVQSGLDALGYFKLAFDYQLQGDYTNALSYYDKVLQVFPNYTQKTGDPLLHYLLAAVSCQKGEIYLNTKQYPQAEASFNASIIIAPDFFRPYAGLALLYFTTGRKDDAILAANRAVAVESNEITHAYRMVINHAYGNWQVACDDYEKIPNKEIFASQIGWAYLQLKNWTKAIQVFNFASQYNPNNANIYHGRGRAYCGIGQYQLSVDDFTKAVSLDPSDNHAFAERAVSYLKLNQYQLALNDSLFALKNDPKDSTALWVLGELKKIKK